MKKELCAKLVIYKDYTEMHGQQDRYVTYGRIPKSAIKKETREESIRKWQNQWEETIKGAITKEFFPSVERRLAVNLQLNPNVTTIMSGHSILPTYLLTYLLTYCTEQSPS